MYILDKGGIVINTVLLISSAVILTGTIATAAYLYYKDNGQINNDNLDNKTVSNLRYFFSKSSSSPQKELIKVIKDACETIDVAVYYISERNIVTHLCSATNRGVKVRIITDKDDSYQETALQQLLDAGIPVKINTYEGKMHLKNMIIDKEIITSGSYNFTYSAEKKNEEVVIISKDKKVAKEWSVKFNEMWNDTINYIPYKPKVNKKFA
ncbi:phospholipase D-like domain-containing protein [Bacillus sp. JJ1521]|uniref:phospholipase D-like domain-containing protein n=1 Tax=Bacillus sp. JJ1521 TaxID=3122957 RepID=UPI002FFFAA5A